MATQTQTKLPLRLPMVLPTTGAGQGGSSTPPGDVASAWDALAGVYVAKRSDAILQKAVAADAQSPQVVVVSDRVGP